VKIDTNKPSYVLFYAAVSSFVFTALIMGLYALARPRIKYNEQQQIERARIELFGRGRIFTDGPVITDPETGATFNLTTVHTTQSISRHEGYIVPISGMGFWTRIDGLMAVSPRPDDMKIKGIVFLSHQETPGLGGRITEKAWRDKFADLDISTTSEWGSFVHIGGERPGNIDAITGATGTSRAVERLLNENITRFRRALDAHLKEGD
jgi:RnfABCDGE-type electron transport complex G subunit